MDLLRSLLFAPGHDAHKMRKALLSEADQVVADMEDAVPPAAKDNALRTIVNLAQNGSRPFYVRINALTSDRTYHDVCQLLMCPGIKGLVVPKIETAAECYTLNWLINALERQHMRAGTDIIPVIETAKGFTALPQICSSAGRIRRLSFGAWDFCADTNRLWDASEDAILCARNELVTSARAADLEAPIDTSYPLLSDMEGLGRSVAAARRMGYQGKACLHPAQLEQVNAGFSPSPQEHKLARTIVKEFRKAEKEGMAAIQVQGQFVDYPIFRQAQRVIKRMRLIKQSESNAKK